MKWFALVAMPVVCVAQAPTAAPVITFQKTHHDFGKVDAGTRVSHRFKVTNTGKAPLQIHRAEPSCGCTSTVTGKWYLTPGESTELEVVFDSRGFRGLVRKSVQVTSSDPATPVATLTFEAEVVAEVVPSTTAVFFTDLPRTTTRKASIRLASGNGKPVQITAAKAAAAPYLATSWRQDGNDVVVDILIDPRKVPAGQTSGLDQVVLQTTSGRVPQIPVDVQWDLKATVVSTPERLAWVETAGKPLQANLQLRHLEGKPFRVTGVKNGRADLVVMGLGQAAAAQQTLQVIFKPSKTGMYQETLVLLLDTPEQSELRVRVTAVIR